MFHYHREVRKGNLLVLKLTWSYGHQIPHPYFLGLLIGSGPFPITLLIELDQPKRRYIIHAWQRKWTMEALSSSELSAPEGSPREGPMLYIHRPFVVCNSFRVW